MSLDLQTPLFRIAAVGPQPSGADPLELWDVSIARLRGPRFEDQIDSTRVSLRLSQLCYAPSMQIIDPIVTFTGLSASGFELSFHCQPDEIDRVIAEIERILAEELDAETIRLDS